MYRIQYDISGALKSDKKKLQKDAFISQKIKKYLEILLQNPFSQLLNIKKLEPKDEQKFRLRVGEYRVIYSLDIGNNVILIHRIGLRKDIYK